MNKIIRITALLMAIILMSFTFAACGDTTETKEPETENKVEEVEKTKYSVTFYADEVPNFVADKVKKSVKILDGETKAELGLVTEVLNEDSICYASNDGKLILTTKTGYRSLIITATVEATETLEGWYIGEELYGIGHKGTFHLGNAEVELTLRSFEVVK